MSSQRLAVDLHLLPPRSPAETPQVRALARSIVPAGELRSVQVSVPRWARPLECTDNVQVMVEQYGGTAQNGWRLLEPLPRVLVEAEFHVVWVSPDGEWLDVTPSPLRGPTLFLPDPGLKYEGRQIDNHRRALQPDPLIDEFIDAAQAWFEVTNRGRLAEVHGDIPMTPEMAEIIERRDRLEAQLRRKYHSSAPRSKRRR